jgi:hypothetical protein
MRDAMPTVIEHVAAVSVALPFARRGGDRASPVNIVSFTLTIITASYLLVSMLRRLSTSAAVIDPTHGRELTVISQLVPANDRLPFEQIAPPVVLFPASDETRAWQVDAALSEVVGQ